MGYNPVGRWKIIRKNARANLHSSEPGAIYLARGTIPGLNEQITQVALSRFVHEIEK